MAVVRKKIRVLIVDDSLLIRTVLEKELGKDPGLEIVGTAADPIEAKEMIVRLKPDVLTLDVEMPKMDGLTFLKILQAKHPMPVVMLSTLTGSGSAVAVEALRCGAMEIMEKPGGGSFLALSRIIDDLSFKIKAVAVAKRKNMFVGVGAGTVPVQAPSVIDPTLLIAIGASTGGTQALRYIFSRLPSRLPPILIVEHMPAGFTASFAGSLDSASEVTVLEAATTYDMRPGQAILARGGKHLVVSRRLTSCQAVPKAGELVCHQCPSVDVLFESVATVVGAGAIGVLLTGMGEDGARGLLSMRGRGAITIAQDENSCVVFGMPKAAIARGAAQQVLPLNRIPQAIVDAVRAKSRSTVSTG